MAKKIIQAQMQQRRDTKANWAAKNPVLLAGELGIVSDDPNLYKVGDGATAWNALPFRGFDGTIAQETGTSENAVMSQKAVTRTLSDLLNEKKRIALTQNRYFNGMNVSVGSTVIGENGTSGSGVACVKIAIQPGEKYRLIGRCNTYAYKGFWITDHNNVVTRIIDAGAESYDVDLTIQEGESLLYVNCVNYDEATDGVWRITEKLSDLTKQVTDLTQEVENTGSREFSETTLLNDKIVAGYAYNLGGNSVGQKYTSTPAANEKYAYLYIPVDPSKTYKIKGLGSSYAFRFYAFFDDSRTILSISSGDFNTRTQPLELRPPQNAATLIVNFMEYNPESDSVECIEPYSIKGTFEATAKRWKGKNIVTFGDSITQFEDSSHSSYPGRLQEITGATVYNVGIGGTQIRTRAELTPAPTNDTQAYAGLDVYSMVLAATTQDYTVVNNCADFVDTNASPMYSAKEAVNRLQSIDWASVDVVVVFAGTNDWHNGSDNLGESGSDDEDTTLGAINKIIQLINSAYPHVQLYWFTPIVRHLGSESSWGESTWAGNTKKGGRTLLEFVDIVKNEVERNNIPVCDLYRTLGWNPYNFKYYFNSGDGTHPDRGLRFIAQKIASFIEANRTFKL